MEFHIGKLIRSVREERGIDQMQVAAGLCSKSGMSKIEWGVLEPGKWMADVMLERLGVSPNKFGCLFSGDEMAEYELRGLLLQLLRLGEVEELRECWQEAWLALEQAERDHRKGTVYQRQFLQYVRLIACYDERAAEALDVKGMTLTEQEQQVRETLALTLPDIRQHDPLHGLLGRMERALMVLLADTLAQQPEKQEEGLELYRRVLLAAEAQIIDPEELQYQYPRIAALAVYRFEQCGCYNESWVSRKAYKILQDGRKVTGMSALLRYEMMCDGERVVDRGRKEEGISALESLLDEVYGYVDAEERKREQYRLMWIELAESNFRGIAMSERISKMRKEQGLTQEDLSKDICTIKTVARLENGRVKPSPYVYRNLLARLGQEEYRYFPFIVSDDYKLHECRRKVASYIAAQEYSYAGEELACLELELDISEKINQQALLELRTIVDKKLNNMDPKEQLINFEQALALTIPKDVNLSSWPLNQTEIELLNNIAEINAETGNVTLAKDILLDVKESCESDRVGVEHNTAQYLLTLHNLLRHLGAIGNYENALEIVELCLESSVKIGSGEFVVEFLYLKEWIIEKQYERSDMLLEDKAKACLPICTQAFKIADITDYSYYKRFIATHCVKEYGVTIK